jgi:hypothetical protein
MIVEIIQMKPVVVGGAVFFLLIIQGIGNLKQ